MKEKIFGSIKIFVACWLAQVTLGWIIGGIYGTAVSVSDYGPSIALVITTPVLLGVAIGLIFAIKALFKSGIGNFRD